MANVALYLDVINLFISILQRTWDGTMQPRLTEQC